LQNKNRKYKIAVCAINTRFSQSSIAVSYLLKYFNDRAAKSGFTFNENDYEISVFEFNLNDSFEYMSRMLFQRQFELYAFSTYIWNRELIKRLIEFVNTAYPEAVTLTGGPEVISACLGDIEAMCGADFSICGEGEEAFAEFLEKQILCFKANVKSINVACGEGRPAGELSELSKIDGLAARFRGKNEFIFNCAEPVIINNPENIAPLYNSQADIKQKSFVYLETSRGCPNQCHYCLSSLKPSNAPAVRYFPIERTLSDIDSIIKIKGLETVRTIDRTFNDDSGRTMAIFRHIVKKAPEGLIFQFEMSPYKFNAEILDFLKSLNRKYFQFEIGIQSFDNESLKSVGRDEMQKDGKDGIENKKITPSKLLDILINETKVEVHADLMYGLPGDTYEKCLNSFDKLLLKMPSSVQFWQLKILRGTKLWQNAEKLGLLYEKYPPYAVIKTQNMSVGEILKLQRLGRFLDLIYNSGHLRNTLGMLFQIFKSPSELFFKIIEYFENNGISETAVSRTNLFMHIKNFAEINIKPINETHYAVIYESLRYDFISGENKKFAMPDFLKFKNFTKKSEYKGYLTLSKKLSESGIKINFAKNFMVFKFNFNVMECKDISSATAPAQTYLLFKSFNSPEGKFMREISIINSNYDIETMNFLYFCFNRIDLSDEWKDNAAITDMNEAEKLKEKVPAHLEQFKKTGWLL